VYRNDYGRSICNTAGGSNCEIVNCVSVRASGINSLYWIRREVICRVIYTTTRDNIILGNTNRLLYLSMSSLNINHARIVNCGNHIHNMSIPPGLKKNTALLTESLLRTAWRNKGIYFLLQGHTVTARSRNWLVTKHSRGLSWGCRQLCASWVAPERRIACYNLSCSKNEVTREWSAMFKGVKRVNSWAARKVLRMTEKLVDRNIRDSALKIPPLHRNQHAYK
jgi:hypothetical protein